MTCAMGGGEVVEKAPVHGLARVPSAAIVVNNVVLDVGAPRALRQSARGSRGNTVVSELGHIFIYYFFANTSIVIV